MYISKMKPLSDYDKGYLDYTKSYGIKPGLRRGKAYLDYHKGYNDAITADYMADKNTVGTVVDNKEAYKR